MRVDQVDGVRFGIGEGALWDEAEARFYAVDVMARQIVRYDPAKTKAERFDVPGIIGSLALRRSGGAIVGLENGVHSYDFETGATELLADPESANRELLLTEGKADPSGRFLFSSFSTAMTEPVGSYYLLDGSRDVRRLRGDVVVPNGLAWSPDGATVYLADSGRSQVFVYDYDLSDGAITNERLFCDTTPLGGVPDGAVVDDDGDYWVAICKAGLVARYAPDGTLRATIEFPTKWVASVAFGGTGRDELYVTSLNPGAMNLGDDPQGGKLFVVHGTGATGPGASRVNF